MNERTTKVLESLGLTPESDLYQEAIRWGLGALPKWMLDVSKVDVATYAFPSASEAWNFQHDCGAAHLTCSGPARTKSGWTVRVLIPNNPARDRADKCANGAPLVLYAFNALPAAVGGLAYAHF